MSGGWPGLALVAGAAVAGALAAAAVRWAPPRLQLANYRGERIPAVLGAGIEGGLVAALLLSWVAGGDRAPGTMEVTLVASSAAVFAAGVADDAWGRGARGLRGHLWRLARGRPTTGIGKLVVGVAVALALALVDGGGPARVAAGTVLVAACVNLWNTLDVVPGRSLKWAAILLALVLAASWEEPAALPLAGALGAALGVAPWDLGERAMLGDGGSNPLGLVVGFGLLTALSTGWLVVGAVAAVALQVVGETVTITRVVDATPPLRWLDRLGRP